MIASGQDQIHLWTLLASQLVPEQARFLCHASVVASWTAACRAGRDPAIALRSRINHA
jgi:hypothetical protein